MDRKDWAKIQNNWDFLRKELTAVYLLDDLKSCPDDILTDEDEQRVKYEPVDADKNEKLLHILKHKPSCLNGYKWFLGVVKKHQKYIFDRLNKTEVDASDVQDEPSYDINSMVREILLKNFVDEAGKSCTLPDVRNAVCVLRGRGVNFDWKDNKLKDFVIEVFSGVLFEPGRKGMVPTFLHLGAKEEKVVVPKVASPLEVPTTTVSAVAVAAAASTGTSEDSNVGAPTHGTSNEPASHHRDIESLTVEELITYLTPIFMSLKLGEHFAEKFKELDIDGVVFLTMKEEDFKQEFSPKELSFGKRRKLMLKIKEMKEQKTEFTKQDIKLPIHTTLTSETDKPEARVAAAPSVLTTQTTTEGNASQTTVAASASEQTKLTRQGDTSARSIAAAPYKEHFRRFDFPVSPTDRYTRGRMIEISGYSRENMINPVKKFLQLEKGEKNLYRKIAKETVMFASACMNDRTNGTLYVGINPLPSDLGQGQVVGIHLDREKCEDNIRQLIGEAFYEDQQDIAFQAVRSGKFIEVADPETQDRPLWVLEVDVVPSGKVVMEEAFFIRGKMVGAHKAKKQQLYRLIDGTITSLSEKDIYDFMKKKKSLTELRLQQEIQSSPSYVPPDLRKKILNLFTGGSETIEDEIYPVLLISPLDTSMDHGYIEENLSFIQYFDTKAVFDFDPTSDSKGIYSANEKRQVYEVHTTENFDKIAGGYSEKDLESLNFSTEKSWIFCNGYSRLRMEEMQPYDWKQKRFDGFKEALRFFHSSIPLGRGILLIFLFSKNYEVLLEAADEVILKFKDQWMVVAETEEIANLWKEQLIMRNVVSKKSLDNRCILGMPWRHVNSTFTQIISPKQTGVCELPTSTGAFCVLKDRIRIEMCDLEILSSKECEADEALNNAESRELLRRKVEEKFFRGSQVQWMNFWFRDNHVLKRLQHKDLIKEVEKSLENPNRDEDVRVNLVTLMHQPGAGGTTSSRQILWDLKEKYRCCVVRKITDETAAQIAKLRSYDEPTTRKPPLILIDNEEKDKVHQLLFELEEKAKVASHYEDQTLNIFCAVLWCHRGVDIQRSDRTQILLKHELHRWELEWFQRKYETLERKFHEDRKVDPKLLVSFNILKTNFDSDYIKRIVIEFMRQIDDTEESVLIRYLSLLNSYDVDFQTMPVSAFDPITEKQLRQKRILQFGVLERSGSRQKGWETKMSTSLRVLVNESSQRGVHGSHIKTIRITSPLLAKEILRYIQKENCLETSEIMIEFLSSVIFDYENGSTNKLLTIIKNVVKKRVTGKDGIGRFSPLILHIHETEGSEKAAEIFVEVHRKTHDPMIAQQIARYYIHTSNWTEAERYAGIATQNRPNSSFLWDTYGQVYKQQLFEYYERAKKGVKISKEDASVILQLAQKAMNIFRKEQILSETEKSFKTNNGGCFGELRVILRLLETFCHFESFPGARDFHRYLVDKDFKTDAFSFLEKHEEEMMKSLGESAFKTIRKLEDESVQIKSDSREEFKLDQHFDRKSLIQLKESVSAHFGEVSTEIPGSLSDEDACEYRRRYARRMGVTSLQGALSLKYENHVDWEDRLVRVYDLMKENVKAKACTAFDLVTILNTVITLHIGESSKIAPIPYSKILEWSMKLYNAKQPDGRPYLETYLYLVLFHFPTESRKAQACNTCSEVKLQEAVNRWNEAFFTNYPKHRDLEQFSRKKDTTLFFLGNGSGLTEIVYQKELMKRGGRMRDDEYWRSDQARRRFQRLEGTLLMSGQEVQLDLQLRGGTKFPLTIPTSKPTKKRTMCLKRVYCVLGFSWSGPKAYDITLDNPSSGSRRRADVVPRSPVQQTHTR
ncbi:sterile alpha motif domain-containing protein 9-like [Haliotis rufescens]|uniref:sterile alpha motif domain-containing protein 9-like n=1 Tax=Haliotis rufescens TaxID=6454 RepID=UPI00201F0084|nr:sterile alpha motif domain-containing protein 9-like [Haliotis rufescens]